MVNLTQEQNLALERMLAGGNVFLTGEAGTGKSTVLREFRRRKGEESVFLAPTGIAAVQLEGTTLHSFFSLPPVLLTPESMEEMGNPKKIALIRAAKTLVVDEISMVRSDLFLAMDLRLRSLALGRDQGKPFGGKQIILCGDFFQLPPVVKNFTEKTYILQELGGGYAFQTPLWNEANFQCVFLRQSLRQGKDPLFLQTLNLLRHGRHDEAAIPLAGKMVTPLEALNQSCLDRPMAPDAPPPIRLCTTNREAATINATMEERLDSPPVFFSAKITGRFQEGDFPTDALLELKVGARVMILCNKHLATGEMEYVNGDLGVVRELREGEDASVLVKLDKGPTVLVGRNQWTNYEYVLEREGKRKFLRQRPVGSFIQIPLKLAYAITIHKSQGLTLEQVELRLGAGCFAHGQLYTALSRCTSFQGLHLNRPVRKEDLILDAEVVEFYETLENPPAPSPEVTLSIPREHEAAVRAFLASLQAGKPPSDAVPAPPPKAPPPPEEEEAPEIAGDKPPSPQREIRKHPTLDLLMNLYLRYQKGEALFSPDDEAVLLELARKYLANGFLSWQDFLLLNRHVHKYRRRPNSRRRRP
ncbi:MAG: ATP-dependent RecD-like DNA helicase [Oligosphaeraceae bacterium]